MFGRDRDAWHLLNCDGSEHPIPMWWDWRIEAWKADPDCGFNLGAPNADGAGYSYLASTVTPSDLKEAIADAVAAEREENDALIRSLAVGYERMRGVLCSMAATSGPDTNWYRYHAERGLNSVPGIWDIAQNPVEAKPGECSWINREGSLEAIRSAAK
ncbi:Rossmann-fold NAD(P)-binding domain-containing protein [Gluconobacter cerevisiae]|uniref:hypothetical protein n=1 Tax=Gluconobacter cerevisiae TaxID=1379734 RepID=UPI001C046204|nr:hypothetical protein [Gluconobacter cerevisiae]